MLKVLRYIFSVVTIAIAAYGLISSNFHYSFIMMISLGLTMFVLGIEEFQRKHKVSGCMYILVFLLSVIAGLQSGTY